MWNHRLKATTARVMPDGQTLRQSRGALAKQLRCAPRRTVRYGCYVGCTGHRGNLPLAQQFEIFCPARSDGVGRWTIRDIFSQQTVGFSPSNCYPCHLLLAALPCAGGLFPIFASHRGRPHYYYAQRHRVLVIVPSVIHPFGIT